MSNDSNPVHVIDEACRHGYQFLFLTGRSIDDLQVADTGEFLPLRQALVRHLYRTHQMPTLEFSLAYGARFNLTALARDEAQAAERRLREQAPNLMNAMAEAARSNTSFPLDRAYRFFSALADGIRSTQPMPPLFVLCEFAEDLAPNSEQGVPGESLVQVSEAIQLLARDHQARRHPLLFGLCGQLARVDPSVTEAFHHIHLSQPTVAEKTRFIEVLRSSGSCTAATLEAGLDVRAMANLTAGTPNRGLEQTFYSSARSGRPVTRAALSRQKHADVLAMSEGTLSMLDTDRVKRINLVGSSVAKVLQLLEVWALQLRQGNPHTPTNILLAGAPSTAKTDLALLTAMRSGVPAYKLNSPKGSFVGQTERRARLMFDLLKNFSPCLGFIDEITDAMPMERQSMNLDSGASSAVAAELLNAFSDSSRAGQCLILATTNCAERIGAAMASRFLIVPVLMPLAQDYPAILASLCQSLTSGPPLDQEHPAIIEAAALFHQKGMSPRKMRGLLSSKLAINGGMLTTDFVRRAAHGAGEQDPKDRASAEYADLHAISVCSDGELFPWHGLAHYPVPAYLEGIVSPSGELDRIALARRMETLSPSVNL